MNGHEGVQHFRETPADLVITDLMMPVKDGITTIRELRQEYPHVKIIAPVNLLRTVAFC